MILSAKEKKQRAEYARRYRKENPLQYAEQQKRYWTRRVKQLKAQAEGKGK